jgi:hypothetical protein
MGNIKIKEFKIITIKDGIKETWELGDGESDKFIRYNGKFWNLIKVENLNGPE